MFEPFQNFLVGASKYYGISKEAAAAKVCSDFRGLIPTIFHERENPEQYISAGFYKDNILVINVENATWSHEVITRKQKIIEEMNKKAGKEVIKNLRTQLKR